MSVELRWEQCCESQDCKKPAHYGALCAACFFAATPARRAAELLASEPAKDADAGAGTGDGYVSRMGAAWLEELWAA
jgi:hypothetical protein